MPTDQHSHGNRRPNFHRGRRGPDRRGDRRPQSQAAPVPAAQAEGIDVDQIVREIKARIAQRHGIDLSASQIQELAARRLEAILDPRGIKPSLLEQLRKSAGTPADIAPVEPPAGYDFEDHTIFDTHNGLLRGIRRCCKPLLKLFFNPNPIAHALNTQAKTQQGRGQAGAGARADAGRMERAALHAGRTAGHRAVPHEHRDTEPGAEGGGAVDARGLLRTPSPRAREHRAAASAAASATQLRPGAIGPGPSSGCAKAGPQTPPARVRAAGAGGAGDAGALAGLTVREPRWQGRGGSGRRRATTTTGTTARLTEMDGPDGERRRGVAVPWTAAPEPAQERLRRRVRASRPPSAAGASRAGAAPAADDGQTGTPEGS